MVIRFIIQSYALTSTIPILEYTSCYTERREFAKMGREVLAQTPHLMKSDLT